jgi:SAM-dependent methyltransferase
MRIQRVSRPNFETLVSPAPDRHAPIYNWHAFKHSFSKDLVGTLIKEFELKRGSWILDPFCGGGTTLLAGKQQGINSRGFDILPFSVFLSNVKIRDYGLKSLLNDYLFLEKDIKKRQGSTATFPDDIEFLKKALPIPVLNELLRIKTSINKVTTTNNRDFFNLAFLGVLEAASNTTKGGGFLRFTEKNVSLPSIARAFWERSTSMFADIMRAHHSAVPGSAKAALGDARMLKTGKCFDAIITSPPYPNRHDYTRIYALELAFDFISNNDDLKKIRYETLRSHVEARKRFDAPEYSEPKELTSLIRKVEANGLNNTQVPDMIRGYFEDMYLVLQQMRERLNPNGHAAIVVSNVRFSGISVPVDTLLAKIGFATGFKSAKIWTARNRGNSPQQMRDHSRKPSRESIVVLTK